MNDRWREILDNLPTVAPRSRLEPYSELIQELRQRKRPYREITRILAEECGLRISHSTLHEFVQRHLAKEPRACAKPEPRLVKDTKAREVDRSATRVKSEISQRIEALRRKPAPAPNNSMEFRFDDSEPLRLRPEKPDRHPRGLVD